MTKTTHSRPGLSAAALRTLALFLMLLDHMWATVVPGNAWMTYAGRLAFPIFAFQLAEGFVRTSDRKRYAKRLLIFALISEIPFNLVYMSSWIFPFHQNTIFTLLLGFMALCGLEQIRKKDAVRKGILLTIGALLLSVIGFVDYGWQGVSTVILFYLCRNFPFAWALQLAGMVYLHAFSVKGQQISLVLFGNEIFFTVQSLAVLALIPIWLYNGKKGNRSRAFQYGAYLFYPLHMIILYLISAFLL